MTARYQKDLKKKIKKRAFRQGRFFYPHLGVFLILLSRTIVKILKRFLAFLKEIPSLVPGWKKKIILFGKEIRKIKWSTILKKAKFFRKKTIVFLKWQNLKTLPKRSYITIKDFSRDLTPAFVAKTVRRHLPLFLAIVFLTPSLILGFIFITSRLYKDNSLAATFTGDIRISKESTTLSTAGGWLKSMAYSGDGQNGDGDYFNPIHPGAAADAGGAGTLAAGTVQLGAVTANNYDGAGPHFIPFKPNADGNLYGVVLALQNTATVANNVNVVVEVLRFPNASYTGTPPSVSWSNYVTCSAVGTCTYGDSADDVIIERQAVMRFDQTISGETLYPGQYGIHYMDFRFDPSLEVTTDQHYGFRVYLNVLTTAASWPRGTASKLLINAANFGLGITNVDVNDANTVTIPLANTNTMVSANSAAGVGAYAGTVSRSQNEHWSGVYSSASGNWTITGSLSGTQTNKLTTAADGGTNSAYINDGVPLTTLTAPATATTRLCVTDATGLAQNQNIDIWDADTAPVTRTISQVNVDDGDCSGNDEIIVTAALSANETYTLDKDASVARSIWKLRIIQGAEEAMTQYISTTKFCVADASAFSESATSNNINLWDNNTALGANRIIASGITIDDAACTANPGDDSITVSSSIANYSVDQSARVAEINVNLSNDGTPDNGDTFRFTSLNMGQNPPKTGNGSTLVLLYGKTVAPATSANNYPWISNLRHPFYVSYGDEETSAPVDGDMVIVGAGAADPDTNDSTNFDNDLLLANTSGHTVAVDKDFEMPLIYTGATGSGVNSGTVTAATASYGGSGFVSMLLTSRSKLAVDNSANQHYRLVAPGRILLSSDASLELGSSSSPLPQTSSVDLYFDSSGPDFSTTLASNCNAAATSCTLTSVDGLYIGDVVEINDDDTAPALFALASVNPSTKVITFIAAANYYPWVASIPTGYNYTTDKNATVKRGPSTNRSTGADRRAFAYGARGYGVRNNIYTQGSDSYRTPVADLAVDIDANIDTGLLAAEQTTAGNTWVDVSTSSGTLAGDWSALDPISVAQGNSLAVSNWDSSLRMGADDNGIQFPTWAGGNTAGAPGTFGYNAEPQYNAEMAEIGTIPLTNIYNYDASGVGGTGYSGNYATTSSWTIFGDEANTEEDDAVYFGDQGGTPIYALEFNIGTALSASATRVWEYYKSGVGWTAFTPTFGWKNVPRGINNYGLGEYCVPFAASPTYPTATVSVANTYTMLVAGQYVKIKDTDSPTIIRRISSVAAGAPANVVFTEVIPSGYTTPTAQICVSNGGSWQTMAPSSLFTQTGRTLVSWNSWDTPSAAKTTINGVSAYWVRNRISAFTSWDTNPTNQTTPVGMQGVENITSYPFTVFNQVNEAKFNHLSKGASFDPNETWTLRYNDNITNVASLKDTRWYESQTTFWGSAHRWQSPNPDGETSAYYEKNVAEAAATNWRTLNGSFAWTDYSVYAKVYMNMANDATTRRLGVFMRQDADDYGYALYITKTNTVQQLQWFTTAAGTETAIGSATNITFSPYQWYCLRVEAEGTNLQAKFWSPASEDADCRGDANEPGGVGSDSDWTESETSTTFTAGRFGLACDTNLCRFDDITVRNTGCTETWFNDNFNDTGCWRLRGSIHGDQGCAYSSVPFTSNYINFTVKHKGGVQSGEAGANAVIGPLNAPEQGDEIYVSPLMRGSNVGLDETAGVTTSDTYSKYENWDFVYDSLQSKWTATGSAYGAAGTATPNSTYTSPNGEISLKIKSGTPSGPKFGSRAAYFQNSYTRGVGNFTGLNTQQSAILMQPYWTMAGSSTQYNIEGSAGVARQRGTIDFWFKPNFSGSPDYPQYLFDYAANSNTDRILVRIMPSGVIESVVGAAYGVGAAGKLTKTFNATAGQWYHFRLVWSDSDVAAPSGNFKRAWLDGSPFDSPGQGGTVGVRAANAGIIHLGNSWRNNNGFDGAIDELAIFDDAIDTAGSWGDPTPPTSAWTSGQTAGVGDYIGTNIFLAHFDEAMEAKKGFIWADYYIGLPMMVFTNGADTITNDRIRVTTYPARTRMWIENTGSQYTAAAKIKYSEGYAPAAESGWGLGFQYHHRAASTNSTNPINSPVLNLRGQIRLWSDEEITPTNRIYAINQSQGIVLYNPKEIDVNHLEMSQMYYGLYINGPAKLTAASHAPQYIRKSTFNNIWYYPVYITGKTLGANTVDGCNFASVDYYYYPYYEASSSNLTLANSYFMGYSASGYQAYLSGGRIFTLSGNKFFSANYPIYLTAGTAKVNLINNQLWRYRRGLTLNGNSFITMSGNSFDGGTSAETNNGYYGTGIYVAPGSSNVEITDSNSTFGKSIWNEVDVSLPPDTTSWLAGSLLRLIGEGTVFNSNFHYLGGATQDKFGGEYLTTAIPGVDVRVSSGKDIVNYTNFGLMRTAGPSLVDTLVKTDGGYAWRQESTSKTDALEYTAKVVGVAGEPLVVTGYIRLNSNYGTDNLPTVTLSGLGMSGVNLTWTAQSTTDTWQQFIVSGTPTESALATLTIAVRSTPVLGDSGTAENVDDAGAINMATVIEDTDKTWTKDQWTGYKMRDDQGFVFDIIGNTPTRLLLKGTRIPFANTLPTQPYGGAYEIYSPPYVYLDDVSVLSGTVDTGTLDYHSQGQPVSPWLATGLTASGIWGAQYSSFADIEGSFGQLVQDALIARYADVSDLSPTTTEFDTNLTVATDDFYNDGVIIFTEGQNQGVVRRVSDYGGASKTITIDPALPFAPADGDRFAILAATSSSTGSGGASAADIWSYALRQLTTADLEGEGTGSLATAADIAALNNISAAQVWAYADKTITGVTSEGAQAIWDTACTILNTSGSVGKKVCDNLDALVSSRSTLTAAQVWEETTKTITGLSDPALVALANSIWDNETKELTYYGNDITAEDVWNALTSSLTMIDSIGKLLVTNVDEQISTRSSQESLDTHAENMATTSATLDAHEAAQSAFRTSTTNTLGTMTVNIASVLSQLTTIEGKIDSLASALTTIEDKIDTVDGVVDSIKTTVDDTNGKVIAMQSVTDDLLEKWDDYDVVDIVAYIDTLETNLGDPEDAAGTDTVFGQIKSAQTSSDETIDLIYTQVQDTHDKVLEVQEELGYNGKSTTAYAEMLTLKAYVDTVESSLSTLDTRTSSIATSLTSVSNDLKTVTDRIGQVSVDSFTQLFEIKATDITSLQNKVLELKAVADIDRQLLEKTVNQPVVKVIMEWGSVIIKFVIVNPSSSTDQKIPFKAFLPKEVKQEYIMDLGGLNLNYDTSTEQYYVTADINLQAGESVIRSVEIKDIWLISEDEVNSLRKQAEEMANGLKETSYFAQALTLKTDINTRLDKVLRKQKENNSTPQDHILAYRENQEDIKAVQDNLTGLKDLVLNSGAGRQFLASIGGIQAFATWGIVLALIFGMGILGSFYYSLWRKKVVTVGIGVKGKKAKIVELPTPLPHQVLNLNMGWLKKPVLGLVMLFKALGLGLTHLLVKIAKLIAKPFIKIFSLPKKIIILFVFVVLLTASLTGGILVAKNSLSNSKKSSEQKLQEALPILSPTPVEEKDEVVMEKVRERLDKISQESSTSSGEVAGAKTEASLTPTSTPTPKYKMLLIKQTPTDWLNVREKPNTAAKILTKIYPGESYPFSEQQNGWYHILLKDLNSGWVSGEYVEVLEEPIGEQKFIELLPPEGSGVNIRREPNKESQVLKTIYLKNKYTVLKEEGDWVKIKLLEDEEGWVAKEFTQEFKD